MKHKLLHLQSLVAVTLCLILSMPFVSCSDDDDEPENSSIVGTWLLSLPEYDGEYWYCQYAFKSDGSFDVKDWSTPSKEPSSYEASGTWSVSNDMLTLKFTDEDPETYRFSLDGNKLVIYDYEEPGANVFVRKLNSIYGISECRNFRAAPARMYCCTGYSGFQLYPV